jgi:hypothetical protein
VVTVAVNIRRDPSFRRAPIGYFDEHVSTQRRSGLVPLPSLAPRVLYQLPSGCADGHPREAARLLQLRAVGAAAGPSSGIPRRLGAHQERCRHALPQVRPFCPLLVLSGIVPCHNPFSLPHRPMGCLSACVSAVALCACVASPTHSEEHLNLAAQAGRHKRTPGASPPGRTTRPTSDRRD